MEYGGRMMAVKKMLTALAFVLIPNVVFAGWNLQKEGPDVFGEKSAILSADFNRSSDAIVFKCNSSGNMSISWLIRVKDVEPAKLSGYILFMIKENDPQKITATLEAWNENYIGFSSSDVVSIKNILYELSNAAGVVRAGYIVTDVDVKDSAELSAYGSTSAIKGFIEHCGGKN